MFQLYVCIDGNKWVEEHPTFAACSARITELAPELHGAAAARVEVIRPDGRWCHEVTR
jgi:hypothetical protein